MWPDWLIMALVIAGLTGFAAMLVGVAWADRKAKRAITEGKEPGFSWAWFIFSVYALAQGAKLFIEECIYERHKESGTAAYVFWQGLGVLVLAAGITAFVNQVKWFIYTRGRRKRDADSD
jgi:hypothetical protein